MTSPVLQVADVGSRLKESHTLARQKRTAPPVWKRDSAGIFLEIVAAAG